MPTTEHCTNGNQDDGESDVDCGGSCPGCDEGQTCADGDDCVTGVCVQESCRSPYPTPQPSPIPTHSPTVIPCEWLDVPEQPALDSVKFSSAAGQLLLAWDSPTDRGGFGGATFACDEMLEFPLVAAATCVWTSSSALVATLDRLATCVPGDNVTALSGRLRPFCSHDDCACWPRANASHAVLKPPDQALVPEVVFVGAASIGSCSDVDLDLSSSAGSGGRDWVAVSWNVSSSLRAANTTALRNYTTAHSDATEPWLFVPNRLLFAGHDYSFSVELTNFLGFSARASHSVRVIADAIPNVMVTAGTRYTMFAPKFLSIFAQASVAVCPNTQARNTKLEYAWALISRAELVSSSVDPRYFKLPAFSLNSTQVNAAPFLVSVSTTDLAPFAFPSANQSYDLQVVVIDAFGLRNAATVELQVGQSELIAVIDGGSRSIGVSENLTLDASSSYDPDIGSSSGIHFNWYCSSSSSDSGTCGGVLEPTATTEQLLSKYGVGTFLFTVRFSVGGVSVGSVD